ncbi:DUF6850 family outer membrane beta-barrel protein [Albibacterium profundi]|uniref:DUF6850 family outer membrane beta-barrel protein n=1 Tax=Albibacterium profundi TaxID=3134906 RepID=A0ABV5CD56_9SPHI
MSSVIEENNSPFTTFQKEYYSSPSLESFERKNSFTQIGASYFYSDQDLFIKQKGSGQQGFRVDAQSYLKNSPSTTLWGNAYYSNKNVKQVNYNESNDFDLVYPYVMADTVGGELSSESYFFSGGLSKQLGAFEYGLQISFRGVQAYRDRDPRPKNISSDIKATLSIATSLLKDYKASADLNLRKYDQENTLDFVSELGAPLIYHDAGLGVYNKVLAGSRNLAYYRGYTIGGQLNLIPSNGNGFVAQIGYHKFSFDKDLAGVADAVGQVNDQQINALLGYLQTTDEHNLSIKLIGIHKNRNGTEAKFDNRNSNHFLQMVSEDIRYRNTRNQLRLEALYGRKTADFDFYIQGKVQYFEDNQNYVSPDRTMDYQNLLVGLNITGVKPLKKAVLSTQLGAQKLQNIDANYFWSDVNWESGIYDMLTSNFQYVSSSSFQVLGKLRVDYSLPKDLNFFVQASGNYTNFTDSYQGNQFIISTGFIF